MRVIVLNTFVDKFNGKQYEVGEKIEIADKSRIKNLEELGLAKAIDVVEDKPLKKTSKKKGE